MNTRETTSGSSKPIGIVLSAAIASGLSFFALDLVWLGIIAQPIYAKHMGDLLTKSTVWSAALMFYVMYIGAIQVHAIWPSDNLKTARWRGAGMGFSDMQPMSLRIKRSSRTGWQLWCPSTLFGSHFDGVLRCRWIPGQRSNVEAPHLRMVFITTASQKRGCAGWLRFPSSYSLRWRW